MRTSEQVAQYVALRRVGYDAELVGTIADAERAAPVQDLLVLDLMLPDGSGFDLIGKLRRAGAATPIIVLLFDRAFVAHTIRGALQARGHNPKHR